MKILVAVDAFKGTLSSYDINTMIDQHFVNSPHVFDYVVMADGGEGTVDALSYAIDGFKKSLIVSGPFGEPIESYYLLSKDHSTAVIEVALSSGLSLIDQLDLNPYKTTTRGLGQTIIDALDQGVTDIIVGIGGSSTNDGGAGMMQALGALFYDQSGNEIPFLTGKTINDVVSISLESVDERVKSVRFKVACDVTNPLLGPTGCAHVYASQKGADDLMVNALEEHMSHFADVVESHVHKVVRHHPGTGAAGGLGFGFVAFLDATLQSGFDLVKEKTNLIGRIKKVDCVITGEGQLDAQSLNGKAPIQVAKIAKKYHKKVIGIFGSSAIDDLPKLFDEVHTVVPKISSKEMALKDPFKTFKQLLTTIRL